MEGLYLRRRYLISFECRRLPHIFTDVLVIGSGAAGLRAAIEASGNAEVILTTKAEILDSNTYHAQGGLAAVISDTDSIEAHIADTIATAAGLGNEEVIREALSAAPEHIEQMRQWGMEFDTDQGALMLGREGGHSADRIVHAAGDATGRVLAETLTARARGCERLKIFEHCFVLDLLTDPPEGGHGATCMGGLTWHPRFGLQVILARRTILAAGGAGVLWRETTNPPGATADAMAMVFRAGGSIADPEMMQFHPTTLYIAGATRSLISEAVRGEGAYLVDRNGQRFMTDCHEMGELAPRDVVSRAIVEQMAKTQATHVYLDVRHIGAEAFAKRFPYINEQCRHFEIDPGRDLIPVHPAAHYMIGGAQVDFDGHTSLVNLLACGEAACTGLHGANRLASNSLTEALVFAKRCGELAVSDQGEANGFHSLRKLGWTVPHSDRTELDLADIRNSLRAVMWRNVGIVRRGERLSETVEIIDFWGRYMLDKEFYDPPSWEMQNMLTAARVIAECALRRTETRGVHYRDDFPRTDPIWARHQLVRRTEHQLVLE